MHKLSVTARLRLLLGFAVLLALHAAAAERQAVPPGAIGPDQRISLQVERMPLPALLDALARESAVDIQLRGKLPGSVVTAAFEGIELREALRRVLAGHSHVLVERAASAATEPVIEVILLGQGPGVQADFAAAGTPAPAVTADSGSLAGPAGEGKRLEERPVEELADTARFARSPRARAAALDALAYRAAGDGEHAVHATEVFAQALSDPHGRVRAQALATLKDTAEALPTDALARMARDDARPALRGQALELLAERDAEAAREPLQAALTDPDPAVKELARSLIEDLGAGS